MEHFIMMGILLKLMQNTKITAKQLAEEFEVSERSVYRYISSLSTCGVPIYTKTGRYGGITLASPIELKKVYFTKEELEALKRLIASSRVTPQIVALSKKIEYLINYPSTPSINAN